MKKIYFMVMLFMLSTVIYANEDVLAKIKEIDSQMYQGTIKSIDTYNTTRGPIIKNVIFCYNNNKYKRTFSLDNKVFCDYYNGKSLVSISKNNTEYSYPSKTNMEYAVISYVTNKPSWCYGRGLSSLANIKFDDKTNILTGTFLLDNTKIVAKLEPSLGYLASRIERHFDGKKFFTVLNNSSPMLVDGKYYIYRNSSLSFRNRAPNKITILEATFKTPEEKDYIFNGKKQGNIVDLRSDGFLVFYKKDELASNISSEELLKETKKRADKILEGKNALLREKEIKQRNKIMSATLFIISSLLVIATIINAFVKINKNKSKNEKH